MRYIIHVLTILATVANGAVLTVAPSGAHYATISGAVAAADAGDTVTVAAGIYNERVAIGTSGTAGNLITVKAVPRRQAFMHGFDIAADYIRIEGFDVTNTDRTAGISVTGDYVCVEDNYCHDMYKAIGITGNHNYVAYNRAYLCQSALGFNGTHILVEHNEVERLVQRLTSFDADYCRFFGDSLIFRYNNFHGTDLEETGDAHVDCYQTFDNNGIFATNVLFEYNIMSDCHQGFIAEGKKYHENGNYTFRNNLFLDLASFGIMGTDVFNITAVHNTFVNVGSWGVAINGAASTGYVIKNNIFFHTTDSPIMLNTSASVDHDYNLYFWCIMVDFTSAAHDIVNQHPLFVNYAAGDYHLQEGSPAVDAGTDVGVTVDYDGRPRVQPDIGAFEADITGAVDPHGMVPGEESSGSLFLPNPVSLSMLKPLTAGGDLRFLSLCGQEIGISDMDAGTYVAWSGEYRVSRKIVIVE